jgi:hypothetical protein
MSRQPVKLSWAERAAGDLIRGLRMQAGLRLLVRPGPLPQIAYDGRSAAMVEPLHGRAERLRAFAPCSYADAARCALLLPLPPARHG